MTTIIEEKIDALHHLRVCAVQWKPFMDVEKDDNGTVIHRSGVNVELFDYLAQALQWTFSFSDVSDDDFAKFGPHGSCFRLLNFDKVDVSAMPSPLKPDFCKLMDVISSPLLMSHFRLIVPWPKEQKTSHLLATIQPFQSTVWLTLIIVPILIIMSMKILTMIYRHRPIDSNLMAYRIQYPFVDLIYTLVNRGTNWNPIFKKVAFRLIIGAWCLATLVLMSFYASTLISFLAVSKLEPIVNSLEELANTRQPLKMMMIRNIPMESRFLDATEGPFKKLGDSLRQNPDCYVKDYPEAFEKIVSSKPLYTMFALDSQSYPFIHNNYKATERNCQFTISKVLSELTQTFHYYTAKHGIFTKPITKKWQVLWDMGILKFWFDSYKPRIDQCILDSKQSQKAEGNSISLKQLEGAFTILGFGLSLSILVFALERCWFAYSRFVNNTNY